MRMRKNVPHSQDAHVFIQPINLRRDIDKKDRENYSPIIFPHIQGVGEMT